MRSVLWLAAALMLLLCSLPLGCGKDTSDNEDPLPSFENAGRRRFPDESFAIGDEVVELPARQEPSGTGQGPRPNPVRNAYFGDLHVHTTYSFDAYAFGTTATPQDAYRYALGEAIQHPAGFDVELREPLDFYAVTDHAMFLGLAAAAGDSATEFSKLPSSEPMRDINAPDNMGFLSIGQRLRAFATFIPQTLSGLLDGSIDAESTTAITKSAWREIIDAAEEFNDPGRFTTFVAYEYTSSSDDSGNLHRNVVFKDSRRLPAVPFSRFHSQNPEGLWDWMDGLRAAGIESLAIPHNSNGSNGQMFKLVDWAGDPMDDAYAVRRLRNEPIVEVTQVKGTSETHPSLSDNDEWAEFEIMPFRVATTKPSEPQGSYVRDALRRGLALESKGVTNPYKFGLIGSSDTHTGAASEDEANFFCKVGILDSTPLLRGSVPLSTWQSLAIGAAELFGLAPAGTRTEVGDRNYISTVTPTFGAAGLAAVWAEENTRESLYRALRRKEAFATSGNRIRVRFFAGFGFDRAKLDSPEAVAHAYRTGVSMGSDLAARGQQAPHFLAWATRDPKGAPLQRLQIVKGWENGGETYEKVFDAACSDGGQVDPASHRCPDNGATVDLSDCSYSQNVGASQLQTLWTDPEFDPSQRAFYYVRVLENPTCRWSTWDALRAGVEPRSDLAKTLQERAWSSPIWYIPQGDSPADTVEPQSGEPAGAEIVSSAPR